MFDSVAPRYDLLNHLLSLNLDRRWRRAATQAAFGTPPAEADPTRLDGRRPLQVLDLCAGTGDLALELVRRSPAARVIALDFVEPMLQRSRARVQSLGLTDRIFPLCGDALQMPFRDGSFDLLTVAFGLRNLSPLERALDEAARVLRPGGRIVILEFALPTRGVWGWFYRFYFFRVLPRIGRWISGTSAYSYLPASVALFPEPAQWSTMLEGHGFVEARWRSLAGGAVALHTASIPIQ